MSLQALKDRIAKLNGRGQDGDDIWKPKGHNVEHVIRLLPYPGADDPFVTVYFHWDVAAERIVCPKCNFDDECEICDYANILKSFKDPTTGRDKAKSDKDADWEVFKQIQAKPSVFAPMVVRGKEDKPRFWGIAQGLVKQLIGVCEDGDRREECGLPKEGTGADEAAVKMLFSTEKAYDIKVKLHEKNTAENPKSMNNSVIDVKTRATPLSTDKALVAKLVSSVKSIWDIYPRQTSSQVASALRKFVGSSSKESGPGGAGIEKGGGAKSAPATNSTEKASRVGGKSVEEAFADMADKA